MCQRWQYDSGGALDGLARQAATVLAAAGREKRLSDLESTMGPAPQGSGWLIFEIEYRVDKEYNPSDPSVDAYFLQVRLLEGGTLASADWHLRWYRSGKETHEFNLPGHSDVRFISQYRIDAENLTWERVEEYPQIKSWEGWAEGGTRRDEPMRVEGYGLASILQTIIDEGAVSGT